ncbi:tetratricopeptide repeat protein [Nodularia sp. LEGE 04288]|uniref:tetratricopeptide repeat protein n=1 Tax=Nodularia sp. LEGE 04288 TaxID=1828639 RepID=UPI001D128AAB|nr:tetratricopeptide repeat protein [Nodularia sp. LEGE 04288]MCC2695854.1 tetratricopeptide repeat protein [Nodularia sp. LEGE 04288]
MTKILDYINHINSQVIDLVNQGDLKQAVLTALKSVKLCQTHKVTEHSIFSDSLNNLAELYRRQGRYSEAEPLYQEVLKTRIRLWGEEHLDVAQSLNNLGAFYFNQGDFFAAEQNFVKALNLWKCLLGNEHLQVATGLNNIAAIYQAQGRYLEAENIYIEVLKIQKSSLESEHPDIWRTLNNLASIYEFQGRYQEAEKTHLSALEIIQKLYGNEHLDVAVSFNNLAALYNSQGLYSQAEDNYLQVLAILQPLPGENHPYIATTLNNIAENYKDQGLYLKAEQLHLTVWEMRKVLFAGEHPDIASSLNNLGEIYLLQGRYWEAEEKYLSALVMRRKLLENQHPDIENSLNNLAVLYIDMGRYTEAEQLYLEVLNMGESSPNQEHPDIANHLNNLATLYQKQGRYSEAEQLYLEVLKLRKKLLGDEHPDIAATLNDIAEVYRLQGRYSQAESVYFQALRMRKKLLGDEHPDIAATLNNLAVLYTNQSQYPQAESLFLQGLAITKNLFGIEHPQVATAMSNLATIYSYQGQYLAAEAIHLEVLKNRRLLFPENHPQIAYSLNNLAETYFSLGRYEEAKQNYLTALDMRKSLLGEEHPDVANSLNHLATVLTATNSWTESLSYRVEASYINDKLISRVFAFSSESDRLALIDKLRLNFDLFLSLVYQHLWENAEARREALNFVLKRKGLTAACLSAQNEALCSDRYPHLQTQFRQLCDLNTQLINLTFSVPDNSDFTAYQSHLSQLSDDYDHLQKYLASQVPEIQLAAQTADCCAIAQTLPTKSILIEFVRFDVFNFHAVPAKGEQQWYPPRYLAFILPSGQPDAVQMIDLGEAEVIDNLIEELRAAILEHNPSLASDSTQQTLGWGLAKSQAIPKLQIKTYNPTVAIQLSQLLFQPIQPLVTNYQHLIFAVDGNLNLLPLQILPLDAVGKNLLMDEYTISYLNVGRDLMRCLTRITSDKQVTGSTSETAMRSQVATSRIADVPLIIADPDFDLAVESTNKITPQQDSNLGTQLQPTNIQFVNTLNGEVLHRAAGTKLLAESISKKLKDARLYLGKDALTTHLTSSNCPSIMLIATHGLFLPNLPPHRQNEELKTPIFSISKAKNPMLRSLLALAGANTWLSGGILPPELGKGCVFAQDIANLDLWANELTVLSACDTARGDIKIGEGVFGLRRAFTVAGTKTLVMSLWKVPDKATALLMECFFDNLQSGMQRTEALQNAQNYIRNITVNKLRRSNLGIEILKELLRVKDLSPQGKINCQEEDTLLQHPFYWGAWICQDTSINQG